MSSRRLAVGMISHETNSFSAVPTTLESFANQRYGLREGQQIVESMRGTKTGIGGFLEVADEQGWEMIGTFMGSATPSANVQADAYSEMKRRLLGHLESAGQLDGVLLHLHGAMLAENAPDAEGDLCAAVRELIGPDVPLVVELDLHGNITPEFCSVVDAAIAYDTNPHIDAYERGLEAASVMAAILNGELERPSVQICKPPMMPPTINMRTAEGPMVTLQERAREWEASPEIVNVALFPGFPYADFEQVGTGIVVTSTNPETGQRCADDIGKLAWEIRHEFLKELPDVPTAVEQALKLVEEGGEGPVILADPADNPGGGGSGDTTELLRELVRRGAVGAVACVWDPETAQQAIEAGIGAEQTFRIGGKASDDYGAPVEVTAVVRTLSDGHFIGHGPVTRGQPVNCGPSALLDVNGLKIVVSSVRHAANDRGYFKFLGVQPEHEPLLMIKSRGHFRADFEPIAQTIIEADAPGAANPNITRYPYHHAPRPIFPLDMNTTWEG